MLNILIKDKYFFPGIINDADQYPTINKSWRNNWDNLITIFDYPEEIRRIIYITNAIESLNSVLKLAATQNSLQGPSN